MCGMLEGISKEEIVLHSRQYIPSFLERVGETTKSSSGFSEIQTGYFEYISTQVYPPRHRVFLVSLCLQANAEMVLKFPSCFSCSPPDLNFLVTFF